jgi:hypothetical protein
MKSRSISILLLLLITLSLNSCEDDPVQPQGIRPTITGRVGLYFTDSSKSLEDKSGVTVNLLGTTTGMVTGSDGKWTIYDAAPGVYTISFSKPGFDSMSRTVKFSGVGVEFVDSITLRSPANRFIVLKTAQPVIGLPNPATQRDSIFALLTGKIIHMKSNNLSARVAWKSSPDDYDNYYFHQLGPLNWDGDNFQALVYYLLRLKGVEITQANMKDLLFWVVDENGNHASNRLSFP